MMVLSVNYFFVKVFFIRLFEVDVINFSLKSKIRLSIGHKIRSFGRLNAKKVHPNLVNIYEESAHSFTCCKNELLSLNLVLYHLRIIYIMDDNHRMKPYENT